MDRFKRMLCRLWPWGRKRLPKEHYEARTKERAEETMMAISRAAESKEREGRFMRFAAKKTGREDVKVLAHESEQTARTLRVQEREIRREAVVQSVIDEDLWGER
jgi:hypothetical protein